MKKNKYLTFVAMAAAALATSCASDDLAGQKQSQTGSQTVTLSASVNDDTNATTRVGMSKDNTSAKFYWHKDDAISVLTVNGSNYSNAKFTTTAENGVTTATFTGDVTGKVGGYAVYPYSESHTFTSETALTYNLPAEYTNYKPETKIFGTNADYPTNSTNIPLVGKIEEGKIAFKHIGGLAVIRIDKMPSASGTLTVTADQQLSGDFTIADLSAAEPKIGTTTESVSDDNKKVTFTFSRASTTSAGVFYLPLATGSYSGVKITVASTDNSTTSTVDYGNVSVSRAGVTAIPLYNNDGTIGKDIDKSCTKNDHKFIDLGLPSGTLWAEMNVGANSATDYGTYYSWSDATSWNDWGNECRLPTKAECQELLNNSYCTWTWDSDKKGFKVTSAKNGNSIFLPAVGLKEGNGSASDSGSKGYYWFSNVNYGTLYFEHTNYGNPKNTGTAPYDNENNCPIRAVATP